MTGQAVHDALIDDRDGPLPAMLLALTMLAGVVDATSILALNQVFVAAMTGNLVFIGLGIAGATGFSVRAPALALSGFVVGALVGAQICRRSGAHRGWALRNITVFKAILAVPVTLMVLLAGDHLPSGVRTGTVGPGWSATGIPSRTSPTNLSISSGTESSVSQWPAP